MKLILKIYVCLMFFAFNTQILAEEIHWGGPQFGYWGSGFNWAGGITPTRTDDVFFGFSVPYTVLVENEQFARNINLTNTFGTLEVLGLSKLEMRGNILNDGVIRLNPKESPDAAVIQFRDNLTLEGNGRLELNGGASKSLVDILLFAALTNGSGHRIEGAGTVAGELINYGVVRATEAGSELVIDDVAGQNFGYMSAQPQSTLYLDDVQMLQGEQGHIEAVGPGARIFFDGARVQNGRVSTRGGGRLEGGGSFDDVRFSKDVRIHIHQGMAFRDTIIEGGQLVLTVPQESTGSLSIFDNLEFESLTEFQLGGQESGEVIVRVFSPEYTGNILIRGSGRFEGAVQNSNGIFADQNGKTLRIDAPHYPDGTLNSSVIRAENGGILDLRGWVYQADDAAVESVGATSEVILNAVVIGGLIRSIDGGRFSVSIDTSFLDTEIFADIYAGKQSVSLLGVIHNNGKIVSDSIFCEDVYLSGEGEIEINQGELTTGLTNSRFQVVNGPAHTIRANGTLEGHLINFGTIETSVDEGYLAVENRILENFGLIQSLDGSNFHIQKSVFQSDSGVIQAVGLGSQVTVGGLRSQGNLEIYGGELRGVNGGKFLIQDELDVEELTISTEITLTQGLLVLGNGVVNNGLIDINPVDDFFGSGVEFGSTNRIDGNGVIRLSSELNRSLIWSTNLIGPVHIGSGQRIEGWGDIQIQMELAGTLAPGLPVGDMKVSKGFEILPTGRIEIEMDADNHDRVVSSSEVSLGGILDVHFVNDFHPVSHWSRSVMVASKIAGGFDELIFPNPPQGLVSRVYNTGTELFIGQTCVSDFTLDGVVDFFDITEFLRLYGLGSLDADMNQDNLLDFFDISTFIEGFTNECAGEVDQ